MGEPAAISRRRLLARIGPLLGRAALVFALLAPALLAASSSAAAGSATTCYDPVPDPVAAGWTQVGFGSVTPGTPLRLVDTGATGGAGLEFVCTDPQHPDGSSLFGASDIVLSARFNFETSGNSPATDGNTAVHVTINDGTKMVRAYIKRTAANTLKVVLAKAGPGNYSNGFDLTGGLVDFKLIRRPDGRGRLEVSNPVAGQPPLFEEFQAGELADSPRPNTKTLEFGSDPSVQAANNTLWETLGLPAVPPPPALAAQVQQPIDADGTSTFNANRGVVPLKFTLAENGSPTCALPPATLRLTRTGGASPGPIDESVYAGPADSGSEFRIADCQYHYNVSARALGPGSYLAEIVIEGAVVGEARFELK